METKFTPGHWTWLPATEVADDIIAAGTSLVAAGIITSSANAHLIAAAPELYEALGKLLDRYVQAIGNEGIECYVARAALAKARGEG